MTDLSTLQARRDQRSMKFTQKCLGDDYLKSWFPLNPVARATYLESLSLRRDPSKKQTHPKLAYIPHEESTEWKAFIDMLVIFAWSDSVPTFFLPNLCQMTSCLAQFGQFWLLIWPVLRNQTKFFTTSRKNVYSTYFWTFNAVQFARRIDLRTEVFIL